MARVIIDGELFEAQNGERLSDVLIRAGKMISMPCGGKGTCGKCRVTVNGADALACGTVIESDISVVLPEKEHIASQESVSAAGAETGRTVLALDLGTTTMALALASPEDGRIIRLTTDVNPQRAFGADVMSRIAYCRAHGFALLQSAVISAINGMLRALGITEADTLYVAGNTTMLHLLFGVDPAPMGVSPYTPVFLEEKTASGESLGLHGVGTVVSLPSAAAFVGADLTAGLNLIGMPPAGRHRLLVDLGTNAEVVLFSRESALCTAAAAGPCFEGANISCGMSASPGAICAFSEEGYRTVDDAPATGLCATGLVDVIAQLRREGVIDETGAMERESVVIAPDVTLTRGDVRQFQLAKAAVCAAVLALMHRARIGFGEIDTLVISGGISAKINVENAAAVGLLPGELKEKCVAAGNSSLLGTIRYACEKNDLSVYLERMRYIDLAADPFFSEKFIENMMFEGNGA